MRFRCFSPPCPSLNRRYEILVCILDAKRHLPPFISLYFTLFNCFVVVALPEEAEWGKKKKESYSFLQAPPKGTRAPGVISPLVNSS